MSAIGTPVTRKEDLRFLVGKGRYTDDMNLPRQTYAFFVRSPYANAAIKSIDIAEAQAAPGVVAVLTGHDVAADKVGGIPTGWLIKSKDGSPMVEPPHPALVADRARHVGDDGGRRHDPGPRRPTPRRGRRSRGRLEDCWSRANCRTTSTRP